MDSESEVDDFGFLRPDPPVPETSTPINLQHTLAGHAPSPTPAPDAVLDAGDLQDVSPISSMDSDPDMSPTVPGTESCSVAITDLKRLCLVCAESREDEQESAHNSVDRLADDIWRVYR